MANELVRARHPGLGAVTALPAEALEHGMCPGWVAVDGPVPDGPKQAAFPAQYADDSEQLPEDTTDNGGEQPPEETTKAARSARKTKE